MRRGGCGIKKISAKPTLAPQTGWSLTSQSSGVSDHPGRCRGPPPHEEGDCLVNHLQFTALPLSGVWLLALTLC